MRRLRPRGSIRLRVALWCAGLVSVTGVLTTIGLLLATQHALRTGQPRPALDGTNPQTVSVDGEAISVLHAVDLLVESTIDRVRLAGLVAVLVLGVVSILVGWLVAGRMLRPALELADAAAAITPGTLSLRVNSSGPDDELRAIADAFDAMLERIDVGLERQKRFVADASHELRTPFAAMRAQIDVALERPTLDAAEVRALLVTLGDVLNRGSELVDAMLALSRAEVPVRQEVVDLADVVGELITATPAAQHLDLRLHLPQLPVVGDPVLLTQLVANLVENAVAYNSDGGLLSVDTSDGQLTIENDGPHVPRDQIPRLTERFHRADGRTRASGGFGLGLSVVAVIAESHEAALTIEPRPAGGLRVTVAFRVSALHE